MYWLECARVPTVSWRRHDRPPIVIANILKFRLQFKRKSHRLLKSTSLLFSRMANLSTIACPGKVFGPDAARVFRDSLHSVCTYIPTVSPGFRKARRSKSEWREHIPTLVQSYVLSARLAPVFRFTLDPQSLVNRRSPYEPIDRSGEHEAPS